MVKFQILEQVQLDYEYSYNARSGWSVESVECPDIIVEERRLYLRGYTTSADFSITEKFFTTPAEAHKLAAVIHETLEDWAKSLDEVPDEVDDVNVFVL